MRGGLLVIILEERVRENWSFNEYSNLWVGFGKLNIILIEKNENLVKVDGINS